VFAQVAPGSSHGYGTLTGGFAQRRSAPVFAPNGVVATSQPLAASAGLAVLRRGGTAVDAAIATAVALTVVQPGFNDVGGDLFAIVWDGTALHGLNASGRAPAALRLDVLAGHHTMPARGWLPVTVPGAPAGWRDLHRCFGRLPFPDLFTDAITYAERGYPVSPTVAAYWQRPRYDIHAGLTGPEFVEWTRVFTPRGRAPRAGERFSNPEAAATLHRVAETDAESFYFGETAEAVAAYATRTGGLLTTDDFARHSSVWLEPVSWPTATTRSGSCHHPGRGSQHSWRWASWTASGTPEEGLRGRGP
jgi:gamma-glutamyltranspeptidase/glutathione hydrolase